MPTHAPPSQPEKPFTKHLAWTLPANALYGLSSLLLLVILNKRGSAAVAGEFSLAMAIAAPAFMFANLRMRTLVASDIHAKVPLGDYFRVRLTLLAITTLLIGLWAAQSPLHFGWLLGLLALSKICEGISDLCLGVQQRRGRLDRVALSLVWQSVLTLSLFAACYLLTQQLTLAVGGLLAGRLLALLLYDLPKLRGFPEEPARPQISPASRPWKLLTTAAPLGVTAALISLCTNLPRYIVADRYDEHKLGLYCSVAIALQAGNLIFVAVEQPALPRLARLLDARDALGFWRLLSILASIFIGFAIVGALAALSMGPAILAALYTPEYRALGGLLALMTATAGVNQIAGVIESSLIATRQTAIQIPMHAITLAACLVGCLVLIPRLELYGAVLALGICRLPFIGIGVWLLRQKLADRPAKTSRDLRRAA